MTNVTGWSQLFDGNMIGAAFAMYDGAFIGWTIFMLFMVYQIMLWLKTQNLTLCWVTGLMFISLYITSGIVKTISLQFIFIILVIELGGILYLTFWK